MRGEDVRPEPTRPHAPARDPRSPLPVESGFDLLKSPIVVAILVTIAAAGLFGIFFLLYQWYGQAPHRLFKIFFGMILLTVLMTRPRWALVMVVFSMPFVEWLPKSGAPMLNSLNLIMIALLLAALFSAISTRTSVLLPSALKKPILFFLAWAFLAWFHALIVPFSESITPLIRLRLLHNGLFGVYLFFLVHRLLAAMPAEDAQRWIKNLAILMAVSAALGTLGLLWQSSGLRQGVRVAGGLGDINKAATYYAMALIWTFSMRRVMGRALWSRLAYVGLIFFNTLGLVLPNSRGGFVAFLVAGVGFSLSRGAKGLAVGLVLLATVPFWVPDYVQERFQETIGVFDAESDRFGAINESAGGRLEFWEAAIDVIIHHPILGVGYGAMPEATAAAVGRYRNTHNFYLELTGEMGIPALLILMLIFYRVIRKARRLSRSREVPDWVQAVGEGTVWLSVALLVANIFGTRFLSYALAGYFFLAAALLERATQEDLWPLRSRSDCSMTEEGDIPQNPNETERRPDGHSD